MSIVKQETQPSIKEQTMITTRMRKAVKPHYQSARTLRLSLAAAAVLVVLIAGGVVVRVRAPQGGAHQPQPTPTIVTPPVLTDAQAFGIAAGSSLPSLRSDQLVSRLDAIQLSGARWIRFDLDWSQVQPTNSQAYDWSAYDRITSAIAERHIGMLAIIDFTPSWARPKGCLENSKCAPADANQFAAFAAVASRRYASKGLHYWEIWNEPNSRDFWQPTANPERYTVLLHATFIALHAADPAAYVLTAGLSPQATGNGAYAPYDFLSAMYRSGAHGSFDAVADHPYTFPLSPAAAANHAWAQMSGPTNSLRSLMVANGDSAKKLWITEFGSPTDGPGAIATINNPNLAAQPYVVDQALQAKILSDAVRLYRSYPWAGPFFYYTYQDPGTDTSTNENFFGLVTASGSRKPAYSVFTQAASVQ